MNIALNVPRLEGTKFTFSLNGPELDEQQGRDLELRIQDKVEGIDSASRLSTERFEVIVANSHLGKIREVQRAVLHIAYLHQVELYDPTPTR